MTTWIAALVSLGVAGSAVVRWGTRWGSTEDERAHPMASDAYLEGGPPSRVTMTRAISIKAPVDEVWPWICQLGRGAGWYSVDRLDNGRKPSAWHVVSWIPEPRPGDATGIGYLRSVNPGRSLAWWLDGGNFLGSRARMVTCFELAADGAGTRVVSRISADASGPTGALALLAFRAVDSIMAVRQLIGLRDRVEYCAKNRNAIKDPETGDRDQYQLYEILYADGGSAGVRGKEGGTRWREAAMRDGVLRRN